MNKFETAATVEEHGRIQVSGVPFAPGTEVEVAITPKAPHQAGLRWEGNVLVHQGVGPNPSVTDLRDERLNRLAEGRSA